MPDLQPKNSKRQSEPATQHVTYSYRNIETPTVIETFHQLQKLSLKYNKQTNSFYAPYSRPTQVRWHQFNQNTHHSLSPLSSPLTYPRIWLLVISTFLTINSIKLVQSSQIILNHFQPCCLGSTSRPFTLHLIHLFTQWLSSALKTSPYHLKWKLKRPQSLHQLKGRCMTMTMSHNTACLDKR